MNQGNQSNQVVNVFISSNNKTNGTVYDFVVNFQENYLKCEKDETIKINLINFNCDNSFYNIKNGVNNQFEIIRKNLSNEIIETIPLSIEEGNYNVFQLRDHLNVLMSGYVKVSYSKIKNIYQYEDIYNDVNFKIYINIINCNQFMGLDAETLIDNTYSYNVNMNYRNKVILKVNGITFERASIENYGKYDKFEQSSMLFIYDKTDIQPNMRISYQNQDGGDSFNYNIYDKSITSLRFLILDENDNPYTDMKDYNMILQFSVIKRNNDEMIVLSRAITDYLKNINVMILMFLEYFNII